MPINATVILDSGCFLKNGSKGAYTEIGYFCSSECAPDLRVLADGKEASTFQNLGDKNCKIVVRHVLANGEIKLKALDSEDGFHDKLLHLEEFYGKVMPVDRKKFDCILRFDSGCFCAAMVKTRSFKKHSRQAGKIKMLRAAAKAAARPIAHNVHVHFTINDGEKLELARNGKVFWSSENSSATERIDIEIIADNSTAEKFFCDIFKDQPDYFWLPNSGDPPPMCPEPPCFP